MYKSASYRISEFTVDKAIKGQFIKSENMLQRSNFLNVPTQPSSSNFSQYVMCVLPINYTIIFIITLHLMPDSFIH